MKYIADADIEMVSNKLDRREMGSLLLDGRVLVFSYRPEDVQSPPSSASLAMVDGDSSSDVFNFGDEVSSRPRSASLDSTGTSSSTHYPKVRRGKSRSGSLSDLGEVTGNLILKYCQEALNTAFPHYEFSVTIAQQFKDEECNGVIDNVNRALAELTMNDADILKELWGAVDGCMEMSKCSCYSYTPPPHEDPFGQRAVWSFHYFFINKEKQRICYFSCIAQAIIHRAQNPYTNDDEDASMSDDGGSSSQAGSSMDGMNDTFEDDGPMSGVSDSDDDHMEFAGI